MKKFRPGTEYIRFSVLNNYTGIFNTKTYYSGIKLIEKEKKEITYSLNQPLRSLPDGTKDILVIDNINKTAYVERRIGIKKLNEISSWTLRTNTNTDWVSIYTNNSNFTNRNANNTNEPIICSHVNYLKSSVGSYINRTQMGVMGYGDSSASLMFTLPSSMFSTSTQWKDFLTTQNNNGIPVTVQYKLATPVIEVLPYQEVQNYDGEI